MLKAEGDLQGQFVRKDKIRFKLNGFVKLLSKYDGEKKEI